MSDKNPFASLLAKFVEFTCSNCGETFHAWPNHGPLCMECERNAQAGAEREWQARRIRESADGMINKWLTSCGMPPRALRATLDQIPAPLAKLLRHPQCHVSELINGGRPGNGFGIRGGVGRGKTYALAAIMRHHALGRWKRTTGHGGSDELERWMDWCEWPARVNDMRLRSVRDHGLADAAQIVNRMCAVPVLVLDDLGAERMRGQYVDDWAASQLDLVVDSRYSNMMPTWYTTNLSVEEFVERYGARFTSRLMENPMVAVPDGPDLRAVPRNGGSDGGTQ